MLSSLRLTSFPYVLLSLICCFPVVAAFIFGILSFNPICPITWFVFILSTTVAY